MRGEVAPPCHRGTDEMAGGGSVPPWDGRGGRWRIHPSLGQTRRLHPRVVRTSRCGHTGAVRTTDERYREPNLQKRILPGTVLFRQKKSLNWFSNHLFNMVAFTIIIANTGKGNSLELENQTPYCHVTNGCYGKLHTLANISLRKQEHEVKTRLLCSLRLQVGGIKYLNLPLVCPATPAEGYIVVGTITM